MPASLDRRHRESELPARPLDSLLRRAADAAQSPAARDWLRAMLAAGERAASTDRPLTLR